MNKKNKRIEICNDFTAYLVRRINKLMPMCKPVRVLVTLSPSDRRYPSIEAMNGKKIYIELMNGKKIYIYINKQDEIGFMAEDYEQDFYLVNDIFRNFNGERYRIFDNYKDLSMVNMIKVVNELVINDLSKMLNEG